ncbi:MAG TPA: pyridoxal 5'-phosphate synthase glutaminase subunit PdxT [Candidatus Nanoarchaeia archaeon]|nr:pyridoxal 5'-phosphate synthase glutaminase subunit PdxT [Candidatus Nanoarchaeia archaeon]
MVSIGVLALQGDFAEHKAMLDRCDITAYFVRTPEELQNVDGLIIPGGESTTISRLMRLNGIDKALQEKIHNGFPVFGTCAGAIVLAHKVLGNKFHDNNGLNALNITVHRNAYGSQVESFETNLHVKGFHNLIPAVFIRAPMMEINDGVEVLSELDMHPVLVRQKNILAATFHPELTKDTRIHQYFVEMVKKNGR